MVRKADFTEDDFILAAIDLVSLGGPSAATMAAIAHNAGAPTGSIYHRFPSRSALLGAAWLRCLTSMTQDVTPFLETGQSHEAISALLTWATKNPAPARLIMLYRENDLIDGELPHDLHKALNTVNKKLGAGLSTLLKKKNKALSAPNLALANFAIFDGPIAAIKPYLRCHKPSLTLNIDKCFAAAHACGKASLKLLD